MTGIARLYHLARTGGTIISRCLASMQHHYLLSEIHPFGVSRFNPLQQAAEWYQLVQPHEVIPITDGDAASVKAAIERIARRVSARDGSLILRDWSHLDWIGWPFNPLPPHHFTWESLLAPEFTSILGRCATVRHPLDHYLSLSQLSVLKPCWNESTLWQGMLEFATAIQSMPWFKYEDFLNHPNDVLEQLCDALKIPFDPQWQQRWMQYTKITGDNLSHQRDKLQRTPRKPVPETVWKQLRSNADFFAILDLLKYPTPLPLQMPRYFLARGNPAALTEPEATDDWDSATAYWQAQWESNPASINHAIQFADALEMAGQPERATEVLRQTIESCGETTQEQCTPALLKIASMFEKLHRRFESIPYRRRIAHLAPDHTQNLFQLSNLLVGIGEVDEALTYCRKLLELDRNHSAAATNFLLYVNYSDRYSPAEIANEHFRLGMRFTERPDRLPRTRVSTSNRLRLGYLAADFYVHPVGKLMLPLLEAHDRERFEIFAYHDSVEQDGITQSTRQAVDQFRSIHGWTDDRVLETIRQDRIDILLDLGGYTGGGNRLHVLARQAAPIQASFLGYPNTSALRTIDYRLTDRYADPPGLTESLYGEKLLWLDHAHLAWRPYEMASSIEVEHQGAPKLGVFNNVAKISPAAIEAYAQILRRVPEARIVLKYGDRFGVACLQNRYRRIFAAAGVTPDRLEFLTSAQTLENHLRTLASVDLALDAFPYQGTMTSLECLSVGTPIVSRCGQYYAHRATSAMMMRLGMPEFVASDTSEYVEIAVQLLQDLPLLRSIRPHLRDRFYSSALTDPHGLMREVESKLLQL